MLTLDRGPLMAALKDLSPLLPSRTTIPILGHLHLDAVPAPPGSAGGDGEVTLTATNLDHTLRVTLPARVQTAVTACVPCDLLLAALKGAPEGADIRLQSAGALTLRLDAGPLRARLPLLEVDDYPDSALRPPDEPAGVEHLEVPARALRKLLVTCRGAMSSEETRYYLCGISLRRHLTRPALLAEATDGHALIRAWLDLPALEGTPALPPAILPAAAVTTLIALLDGRDDLVSLHLSERGFSLDLPGRRYSGKLIQGTYPETERFFARGDLPLRATLPRQDLLQAIDAVDAFAPKLDTEKTVRALHLQGGEGQVLLAAGDQTQVATRRLTSGIQGQIVRRAVFSARLLNTVLRSLPDERIALESNEAPPEGGLGDVLYISPAEAGDDSDTWRALVMPRRQEPLNLSALEGDAP